jgi:hypothetical protein
MNKSKLTVMKTKKNAIRLTEGELKNIISESVNNILKEYANYEDDGALPQGVSPKRMGYIMKSHYSGDRNHKQSYDDYVQTRQKRERQNGWIGHADSNPNAKNHGAPAKVQVLQALDSANKMILDAFYKYDEYNSFDDEVSKIVYNVSDVIFNAIEDIRNSDERIEGRFSDFRGR